MIFSKLKRELIQALEYTYQKNEELEEANAELTRELRSQQSALNEIKEELKHTKEKVEDTVVENYFFDCPCCEAPKYISKCCAVAFKRPELGMRALFFLRAYTSDDTAYTDKESYETHKKKIDEWNKDKE